MIHILNFASAIRKVTVNELRDFIFENYYKRIRLLKKAVIIQWNAWKDLMLLATKLIEQVANSRNAKEHC